MRCKKKISDKEKRVRITTFMVDKKDVDEWFHWKCWVDGFKESVQKKSMQVIGTSMNKAKGILGGLLGNSDFNETMRNMPQ